MSPAPNAPGRFVVLVGPDGVGKTAVARALLAHHRGPSAYFHFLPPLHGQLSGCAEPMATAPAKAASDGWLVVGWVRLLKNAVRCWIGYLRTVRPALKRNCLVVGDRWMYGYVVQPGALKFRGPEVLARAVLYLLPRPDMIVNLTAPASVIRARKEELTLAEIEGELLVWSSLRFPNFKVLDATRSPQDIAQEILMRLGSAGGRTG